MKVPSFLTKNAGLQPAVPVAEIVTDAGAVNVNTFTIPFALATDNVSVAPTVAEEAMEVMSNVVFNSVLFNTVLYGEPEYNKHSFLPVFASVK